jgi:hypothetical protein
MTDCLSNMMQYLMFNSMKSESNEILEEIVWWSNDFADFECFVRLRFEDVVKTEIECFEILIDDLCMQWLNHCLRRR